MAMTVIWVSMVVVSLIWGAATGRAAEVGNAAMEGCSAAVNLCISIGGMMCLWSGVMEVMKHSGLSAGLSRLLRPVLGRLYPTAARHSEVMDALSANVSANLLGLGNAATPAGLKAATGMLRISGGNTATDELCLLVVMNTASIQLLPTTVATVRAAAGAAVPFDILPAVWISSALSVASGMVCAKLLARFFKP
ncbi:MAG: nucleoside recognition domain-containing protein [Oscillospiraceae bacterium]|jgi:spore maturation protein A